MASVDENGDFNRKYLLWNGLFVDWLNGCPGIDTVAIPLLAAYAVVHTFYNTYRRMCSSQTKNIFKYNKNIMGLRREKKTDNLQ